jgi:outer membrane protein assembly factor BamB
MRFRITLLALATLAPFGSPRADDWPAWRGPTGQGHSAETNLPLEWSETKNVKWKVPLEFQGFSTPIVLGEKIFLTQGSVGGHTRSLLCLSRKDGSELWRTEVPYAAKETSWKPEWYANASPVTDGERVVVSFGSAGMFCYDLEGKEIWKRDDLGTWEHKFGNGASPVLHENLAILWCGPNEKQGRNFLIAVDKRTGKTVWEHDEKFGSWGTPLIVEVDGQPQLLLSTGPDKKNEENPAAAYLKGFDPGTGKELWFAQGVNSYQYASPLYADGVAVAMSGYGGSAIAVKVEGSGDITENRLWRQAKAIQRVGTGVIVDGHVYIVEDNGVPHCYDLRTGEEVWQVQERAGNGTWGSIVHADGRLYVFMKNGETVVLDAKPQYKVLARNPLGRGQSANASPAVSDGEIFLRTFSHLWCIAEE